LSGFLHREKFYADGGRLKAAETRLDVSWMYRRSFLTLSAAAMTPWPVRVVSAAPASAAPGLRRLNLVNAHTGERFDGPYRNDSGPIPDALQELSHFLRDFRRDATIAIDIGVLDFLASVLDAVGASRATVLSAYRTPETNAMLARTMLGVAERSQHLYGRALDIYLPARLEDAMLAARAMRRGGVGWYPNSHFVHLDSGPVRNWSLGEKGLGRMLLDNKPSRYFPDSIDISPGGEFYSRRSGQPITPTDRLAIHRLLQDALKLPAK
jgi:uncharacterized protein YcbK (DUF882 family)